MDRNPRSGRPRICHDALCRDPERRLRSRTGNRRRTGPRTARQHRQQRLDRHPPQRELCGFVHRSHGRRGALRVEGPRRHLVASRGERHGPQPYTQLLQPLRLRGRALHDGRRRRKPETADFALGGQRRDLDRTHRRHERRTAHRRLPLGRRAGGGLRRPPLAGLRNGRKRHLHQTSVRHFRTRRCRPARRVELDEIRQPDHRQ